MALLPGQLTDKFRGRTGKQFLGPAVLLDFPLIHHQYLGSQL